MRAVGIDASAPVVASIMSDQTAAALAQDRIIDITTIGRKTGAPRRIEIWFHRVDGRYYITGSATSPLVEVTFPGREAKTP